MGTFPELSPECGDWTPNATSRKAHAFGDLILFRYKLRTAEAGSMKALLVVAVALVLSGCADTNFYGERDSDAAVAEAAPPPTPPAPAEVAVMTAAPSDTAVHSEPLPPPASTGEVVAEVPPPPPPSQEVMPAPAEDTSAAPPPVMHDAPAPVAVVETTKLPPNAHCMALAKQRAIDAAYQGEDPDTQEAVHDRTYTECVAWDLKHAFR